MRTIPALSGELQLSRPTVSSALEALCGLGIVSEISGKHPEVFAYDEYLRVLNEGTE